MAGKQSAFITGANARIKAAGKTLAYCTDVSYNLTVQTIPIETMGTYEVRDNVPVAFTVDGTFSIIRYTKNAASIKTPGDASINQSAINGNHPSAIGAPDENLGKHLNPKQLLQSGTFDLEIGERLALAAGTGEGDVKGVFKVQNCRLTRRGMTLNKRGVYVDQYAYVGVLAGDTEDSGAATEDVVGPSGVGEDLS